TQKKIVYSFLLRGQVLNPKILYNGQLPITAVIKNTQPRTDRIIPDMPVTICRNQRTPNIIPNSTLANLSVEPTFCVMLFIFIVYIV
ncbi:MAG TPA: hypothetical protein VKI61_17150, partial [Chitinophagaceae bacterium]|nr:hypothetical protein [Chitinophagaceae bacterium]